MDPVGENPEWRVYIMFNNSGITPHCSTSSLVTTCCYTTLRCSSCLSAQRGSVCQLWYVCFLCPSSFKRKSICPYESVCPSTAARTSRLPPTADTGRSSPSNVTSTT
ncbi:hypothetical protein J6590_016214 [Homalodisca vitripennis]|nr:hypothetical protein J6590_016214 [Homalodisca vitripennis]